MYERFALWCRGYLNLEIKQADALSFFNACYENNIEIFAVATTMEQINFCLMRSDLLRFDQMANEETLSYSVKKRKGLPFMVRRLVNNYFFLSGILIFVALLLYLSNIVFSVNVKGVSPFVYISASEIKALAEEKGIRTGAFIPKLDFDATEHYIRVKNKFVAFAAISRHGAHIFIEIKEKTMLEQKNMPQPSGDIVAQCDGMIEEMFVLNGTPMVAIGDTVQAGQILIAGIEGEQLVAAQGMIKARISYRDTASVSLKQEQFSLTGEKAYSLYLCWSSLAQLIIMGERDTPFEYFTVADEKQFLVLNKKLRLPCFLVKRIYSEQEVFEIEQDMTSAKAAAEELAYAGALAKLPIIGAAVISKTIIFDEQNPAQASATAEIVAVRDFGIFQPY